MNNSEAHFYLEELQRMMTQYRGIFSKEFVCANGMAILALEQEQKKGKWIIVTDSRGRHAECPYCGEWKYHSNQKFCGECGAQMEGEEE